MAAVRGIELGVSVADFERVLLDAADGSRSGAAQAVTGVVDSTSTETVDVTGGPEALTEASTGDDVVGTVELDPANTGSLVRFRPTVMEPGTRPASHAVATLRFADERWGTGFGPLEIAPDVRHQPPPSSRHANSMDCPRQRRLRAGGQGHVGAEAAGCF